MGLRVGECRARDCGDVVRVGEGLCAVTAGTVIAPPAGLRKVSLKFCMNHAGRRMAWVTPGRPRRSSSTRRMAVSGGAESVPWALR